MAILIPTAQPKISYGFTDYNGNDWSDWEVDQYNAFLFDVNKNAGIDIKSGSLREKELNIWLDRRHKFFSSTVKFYHKQRIDETVC